MERRLWVEGGGCRYCWPGVWIDAGHTMVCCEKCERLDGVGGLGISHSCWLQTLFLSMYFLSPSLSWRIIWKDVFLGDNVRCLCC